MCDLIDSQLQPVGFGARTEQCGTHLGSVYSRNAFLERIVSSELELEFGLEGLRPWTDAGNAVDSVAPKLSIVVHDREAKLSSWAQRSEYGSTRRDTYSPLECPRSGVADISLWKTSWREFRSRSTR